MKKHNSEEALDIYSVDVKSKLEIPISKNTISAGFPSPADDYMELKLDLNKELISNPSSTFYAKVKGNSMEPGIRDGDILVIDKSKEPTNGAVAVCYIDGEFTVKKIMKTEKGCFLLPSNDKYKPIHVTEENDFIIWGIVTFSIHRH